VRETVVGSNTISSSPGGVDVVRWSGTQAALALGDLGMDVGTGRGQQFRSGATRGVLDELDLTTITPTESGEISPIPETRVAGNATRIAQTNFDGASYILRRRTEFNRIIFRVTVVVAAPTLTIQVFQTANGGSGVANRIATVTAFAPAVGTNVATPAEGTVTAVGGLIYVLFGRDSGAGTATFRAALVSSNDLYNQNVDTDTHPTNFTTAIAANTTPATFDPRQTPTGQATDTALDTVLSARLKKV
jgi:hypothetical protein